jgi:hypothetical protein
MKRIKGSVIYSTRCPCPTITTTKSRESNCVFDAVLKPRTIGESGRLGSNNTVRDMEKLISSHILASDLLAQVGSGDKDLYIG